MALQEEFEKQGNWLFRYRGTLPLIIFIFTIIFYLITEIHPELFILEGTPYEIYYEMFCLFIGLVGLAIRVYTVGYTEKNTSGRNVGKQVADSLNTTGIYSVIRHPLYLGNFFMWLGPILLTANFLFIILFCLVYWIYYERIMFAEEQYLRNKMGKIYLEWSKNVPAFLPRFKQFKKSNLSFNWKKVLRQEKNGFMALFLIFLLFDTLGEIVEKQTDYNIFLIFMAIFSTFSYLVLKYLKKKTNVLKDN